MYRKVNQTKLNRKLNQELNQKINQNSIKETQSKFNHARKGTGKKKIESRGCKEIIAHAMNESV
jgi:hypothetical protein